MSATNPYCEALGIQVPRLEEAKNRPDANYYSLLIVALLERGGPITLEEAAKRLEEAGVAPASGALRSLKKCKPARSPIYRVGNLYALDPHDDDTDLWTFRLGLKPPKALPPPTVSRKPAPLPSLDAPLEVSDLDEMLPAPWVHRDEPRLHDLMRRAHKLQAPLEVVVGSAPGWADPWSRARRAYVQKDEPWWWRLVDEHSSLIFESDVQLARLEETH